MTRPAGHLAPRRIRRRLAAAVGRAGLYLVLAVAGALVVNALVGGTAARSGRSGPRPVDVAPLSIGDGQPMPPTGGSGGEAPAPVAPPQPSPATSDPQAARLAALMAQQQASAKGHLASGVWGTGAAGTKVARIINSSGPVAPQTQAAANAVVSNVPGADAITLGGTRPDGVDPNGHPAGLAIDYMVMSDQALGEAIVAYHIAHWSELRTFYIIYRQHILASPNGAWQPMEDRGSPTANHMDHVHVSYQR